RGERLQAIGQPAGERPRDAVDGPRRAGHRHPSPDPLDRPPGGGPCRRKDYLTTEGTYSHPSGEGGHAAGLAGNRRRSYDRECDGTRRQVLSRSQPSVWPRGGPTPRGYAVARPPRSVDAPWAPTKKPDWIIPGPAPAVTPGKGGHANGLGGDPLQV